MSEAVRKTHVHPKHLAEYRRMVTESIDYHKRTINRLTFQLRNAETSFDRLVFDNRRNKALDRHAELVEKKRQLIFGDVHFHVELGDAWRDELVENGIKLATRPYSKKTLDDEVRATHLLPMFSQEFEV